MNTKLGLALIAAFATAVPASAQLSTTDRIRDRIIIATGGRVDSRTGEVRTGSDARRDGAVRNRSTRVPPGHLPPRGMCRVWVDGVPPGQQPPVTSCAQAEQDRLRYGASARVIYGDRESFRGRGNGKFRDRERRECQLRDAVVIDGRVVDVCSDDNARGNRRGRDAGRRIDHDDEDSDDEDSDDDDRRDKLSKAEKERMKAARKAAKRNGR